MFICELLVSNHCSALQEEVSLGILDHRGRQPGRTAALARGVHPNGSHLLDELQKLTLGSGLKQLQSDLCFIPIIIIYLYVCMYVCYRVSHKQYIDVSSQLQAVGQHLSEA